MKTITAEDYKKATGADPENDDLERVNCTQLGQVGHQQCGWCPKCNLPRFCCGHNLTLKKEDAVKLNAARLLQELNARESACEREQGDNNPRLSVREKLNLKLYENVLPFPVRTAPNYKELRQAYNLETARLRKLFECEADQQEYEDWVAAGMPGLVYPENAPPRA